MKHNLKIKKAIQNLGMVLLASIILLSSVAATTPIEVNSKSVTEVAISKYIAAQANPQLSNEEKIKTAIDAYFTTRYEGQRLLAAQDFSPLLADDTLAWVQKEKDKREIELYTATLFGLKYISYNYTLNYDSIEIKNNNAIVKLKENHEVIFEAIAPEVSKLANLQHVFTLHNKKDGWVIYKDEYQDELSQQFDKLSKNDIKEQVDKNYQSDLDRKAISRPLGNKVLASLSYRPLGLTAITYNRTAAYQYADYYWNNNTFTPYYRVDPSGNDCANYVAQAINAGLTNASPTTIPVATAMGPFGTYPPGDANWSQRWYYIFNTSGPSLAYSASFAWINVQGQYNFITTNNWTKGPYGSVTTLCGLRTGDIVQLQGVRLAGAWDHEGIIVGLLGACQLSNYWVDAHTTPRYHYLLSNWASYPMRFIHITGGYQ